jgi:soluble lytic murein transglycosylase-like protein
MYFRTYGAALTKLRALIAAGQKNIDIGLMQVNWGANGWRLRDPARLLLPEGNIHVAASLLHDLQNRCHGDWGLAIALYHSPRWEIGIPYERSVLGLRQWLIARPEVGKELT